MSMNIPPRKDEEPIIPTPQECDLTLTSRCENPPIPAPCDLRMLKFMITFTSSFRRGEAHMWRTFPKFGAKLGYCLALGPLF